LVDLETRNAGETATAGPLHRLKVYLHANSPEIRGVVWQRRLDGSKSQTPRPKQGADARLAQAADEQIPRWRLYMSHCRVDSGLQNTTYARAGRSDPALPFLT